MYPWPLNQIRCTFRSFFNSSSSRPEWLLWSEPGKQWILWWKSSQQVYSICLPLSCIGYFNFPLISTHGNTCTEDFFFFFFLATRELFIDELFNKCFHLQENAKKILKRWSFFLIIILSVFCKTKIEVFLRFWQDLKSDIEVMIFIFKNLSLPETVVPPALWLSYRESWVRAVWEWVGGGVGYCPGHHPVLSPPPFKIIHHEVKEPSSEVP